MRIILLSLLMVGCSAVPVKQKFPDAPPVLLKECENLDKLNDDTKLSGVAKTVTENYTKYHECAYKNGAWIEWYKIQKNIFEEANK